VFAESFKNPPLLKSPKKTGAYDPFGGFGGFFLTLYIIFADRVVTL